MSDSAAKPKPGVIAAFQPPSGDKLRKGNLRSSRQDDHGDIEGAIARMRPSIGLEDADNPVSGASEHEIAVEPAVRPVCALNPDIELPLDGEVIPWDANVRMDLPRYIQEQVKEVCHRGRHTMPYLFLKLLADVKDDKGDPLFYVREEDLAKKDRRYTKR